MAQDLTKTRAHLERLLKAKPPAVMDLPLASARLAVVSDAHLGDGGEADDFCRNEQALVTAIHYWREHDFTVVLLGDIEEFWQFDPEPIRNRYSKTVYAALRGLPRGRLIRVFGNHDSEWGSPMDPAFRSKRQLGCPEALRLVDREGRPRVILLHGHQGSDDSDRYCWLSRTLVRLGRSVEGFASRLGIYRNPSATKSMVTKEYEQVWYECARDSHVALVCGHSHRAIAASRSWCDLLREQLAALQFQLREASSQRASVDLSQQIAEKERELAEEVAKGRDAGPLDPKGRCVPCYFNTGCAIYSDGLTALEIQDDEIRLVRWSRDPSRGRTALSSFNLATVLQGIA